MAPVAFRTLTAALGLSLAAQAAGQQDLSPIVAYTLEDVARQAELVQSTITWQAAQFKEKLAVMTDDALEHNRRLQSASPCLWSSNMCDINPAYFTEKAGMLPQGSPASMAMAMDKACGTLKDMAACNANTTCMWNDGPSMCNVNVNKQMDTIASTLFDPSTCGSSDGAKMLQALMGPSVCDTLAQTDCKANSKCSWGTGYSMTGSTCTPTTSCMKGPDADAMNMCPPTFNQTAAHMACAMNITDPTNTTAMMLCTMQGCPIMYNNFVAQLALMPTCGPLMTPSACNANPKCMWQMDHSSMNMTMTCQGIVDTMGIAMQGVPDSCKLKGMLLLNGKCGMASSQAGCTGDCAWQPQPYCGPTGAVQSSMSCGPSPAAMTKTYTDIAGNGPVGMLAQAKSSCEMATTQAACTAVARPSEGATTTSGAGWFAVPSMLAAAFIVSAGVQLF